MYFLAVLFILFGTHESFASFQEVIEERDPYGKGKFLSIKATSFALDESALVYPSSKGKKGLLKAVIASDRALMFYLSKNEGVSLEEKIQHRLQAFQHILASYDTEFEIEDASRFVPLFKFTGGNWMRLQGFIWRKGTLLRYIICPDKKIKRGRIDKKALKFVPHLTVPYYRFLSRQERQIRGGASSRVPRDQKEQRDRTPKPRSLRKGKNGNRGW
tara:strand:- start:3231 stop:3878 length:648 start_codon:yes stop_codon:yes gene_type:complete